MALIVLGTGVAVTVRGATTFSPTYYLFLYVEMEAMSRPSFLLCSYRSVPVCLLRLCLVGWGSSPSRTGFLCLGGTHDSCHPPPPES